MDLILQSPFLILLVWVGGMCTLAKGLQLLALALGMEDPFHFEFYFEPSAPQTAVEAQERPHPLELQLNLRRTFGHLESGRSIFEGALDGHGVRVSCGWNRYTIEVACDGLDGPASDLSELLGQPATLTAREPMLTAGLDTEGRLALSRYLDDPRAEPRAGWLVLKGKDLPARMEGLPEMTRSLTALARRLSPPHAAQPDALLRNLAQARALDGETLAIQRRNLRMLVGHFPLSPQRQSARALLEREADRELQALLSRGRGVDSADEMRTLLTDRGAAPRLRLEAVEHLGRLRDRAAVPGLVFCLEDRDTPLALAAVQALRRLKIPAAIRPLVATLDRPEPELRLAAVRALEAIGDAWAGAALRDWIKRNQKKDRATASAARLAAARLQDRYGTEVPGEPGAIALSHQASDGAVSMAHDTGAVSLARRQTE